MHNRHGRGGVLLLCEHASNAMPEHYQGLGLSAADRERHIAWDPGAQLTAQHLSQALDAPLVCSTLSRLLLDVNRPIEAADSIIAVSEGTAIPGNQMIDAAERAHRQAWIYQPFHATVAALLDQRGAAGLATVVISVHSFTPRYHDVARPWHVGVLSQHDRRLANALLADFATDRALCVGDNQPYAPRDGVYHSMSRHGEARGLPCAMLEIRNDLIADSTGQLQWAGRMHDAIARALATLAH